VTAFQHLLDNCSSELLDTCSALSILQHNEALIEEFIHFSMGGVYSSFMLGGLKVSSWAKRLLLRESSISQAVDTLHTIARVSAAGIGWCQCSIGGRGTQVV
jgi:hypothetical protein